MKTEELIGRMASGEAGVAKDLLAMGSEPSTRHEVVRGLIAFLEKWQEGEFPRGAAVTAINVLGELGAEEAVPTLLDYLFFQPEDPATVTFGNRLKAYMPPAATALIKIGEKAVPSVIEYLRKSDPQNAAIPALVEKILSGILGVDPGKELIQRELASCTDPTEKKRFEECLQYFYRKEASVKR